MAVIEQSVQSLQRVSAKAKSMIPLIQKCLCSQPVRRAWLFGSYSRGEETEKSDIDILVQYEDSAKMSLMDICRIMCSLEDALSVKVDLVEDGRLMPFATESVNRDKVLVYERANVQYAPCLGS